MVLENEIQEITGLIEKSEMESPEVSKVKVAWHLEHVMVAICKVCKAIQLSNPSEYKWKFNKVRTYIFLKGSIPRGKAKAPKSVKIEVAIGKAELQILLDKTIEKLKSLDTLDNNSHFEHPYFGDLNLRRSKYFLKLHTVHHLKIVRDIIEGRIQ